MKKNSGDMPVDIKIFYNLIDLYQIWRNTREKTVNYNITKK